MDRLFALKTLSIFVVFDIEAFLLGDGQLRPVRKQPVSSGVGVNRTIHATRGPYQFGVWLPSLRMKNPSRHP